MLNFLRSQVQKSVSFTAKLHVQTVISFTLENIVHQPRYEIQISGRVLDLRQNTSPEMETCCAMAGESDY